MRANRRHRHWDDFRASYSRRRITDERAFAHYFSNKGVEQMQSGKKVEAFAMFRVAIDLERNFAPAWSNLSRLYEAQGDEMQARKWLNKAEEVAQSDALKRNYQSKVNLLLSAE